MRQNFFFFNAGSLGKGWGGSGEWVGAGGQYFGVLAWRVQPGLPELHCSGSCNPDCSEPGLILLLGSLGGR